ncbi:MAG: superoxide dismutase [Defluviitoga tunisiensis]|jgi:Fe-Mn family superoxide dismutase|uniref:Superoxide dismutase n=1 Tax=Defluviitoga tunisiensis TaxID=1006576 RepID=A0A0C7NIR4_DEFTU|nr:superoxide dismutase [Defluviitoga tunisiensis]MDD3600438.1 superoxide dismutase [Defluviitoga tunisiensis]MDY0380380.1 superoxide dismutase [Defluviitoga tunisiensis]CEP77801.1 Superoxide dismutase [Defluviitoga tunisiensis]HHV00901.1 superoxide dismutase [Defluviitoga tunisiensis]HOB55953.1 superoxide dismutase [Defluviitoga tunisiensis]
MRFELPKLNYSYDSLEPYIDSRTMEIHYTKHHATYVNKLNEALEKHPELMNKNLEDLLKDLDNIPSDIRTTVRNNGGGHYNHTLFWSIMGPNGSRKPIGKLAQRIDEVFGSFDKFKLEFSDSALNRFGSGWAWLVLDKYGHLSIISTPNQDNPIMIGLYPILGIDVWEHAYYLKYQNRRAEYIESWWNVVNWEEVEKNYLNIV